MCAKLYFPSSLVRFLLYISYVKHLHSKHSYIFFYIFFACVIQTTVRYCLFERIMTELSGVAKPEFFFTHTKENLEEKKFPSVASEIGATLKGKNLLPLGANSFL